MSLRCLPPYIEASSAHSSSSSWSLAWFLSTPWALKSLRYYDVSLVIIGILTVHELMALFVCDTPQWLMANKRTHSARRALRWLRGKGTDISVEWKAMENDLSKNSVAGLSSVLRSLGRKK